MALPSLRWPQSSHRGRMWRAETGAGSAEGAPRAAGAAAGASISRGEPATPGRDHDGGPSAGTRSCGPRRIDGGPRSPRRGPRRTPARRAARTGPPTRSRRSGARPSSVRSAARGDRRAGRRRGSGGRSSPSGACARERRPPRCSRSRTARRHRSRSQANGSSGAMKATRRATPPGGSRRAISILGPVERLDVGGDHVPGAPYSLDLDRDELDHATGARHGRRTCPTRATGRRRSPPGRRPPASPWAR